MFEPSEQHIKLFYGAHNRKQLAQSLDISYEQLLYLWDMFKKDPIRLYRHFELEKRNGEARRILAPRADLKDVQRRIATLLETRFQPSAAAHGFISGRNIITNARPHVGKQCILTIDLKDFFESIKVPTISYFLSRSPFNAQPLTTHFVTQFACCRPLHRPSFTGFLPQGSPSSPILSNIVATRLDLKLIEFARSNNMYYTRYVDDLTFSTNRKHISTGEIAQIVHLIERGLSPFKVNPAKIRIARKGARHTVTGLTVNEHVNISRRYLKNLRAELYQLENTPNDSVFHLALKSSLSERTNSNQATYYLSETGETIENFIANTELKYLQQIEGKIEFVRQVLGEESGYYLSLRKRFDAIRFGEEEK